MSEPEILDRARVLAAVRDLQRTVEPDFNRAKLSDEQIRNVIDSRFLTAREMLWWTSRLARVLQPDEDIATLTALVEHRLAAVCRTISILQSVN